MHPQHLLALAVRLFAIWLAVSTIQLIAIATSMQQNYPQSGWLLFAVPCVTLLLVVVMWSFPLSIANKLLPEMAAAETPKMPTRDLAAAASAILGLWVIVSSLPHVVGDLGIVLFAMETAYFDSAHIIQAVATGIQFVVGIYLLVKPWNIANKIFPSGK